MATPTLNWTVNKERGTISFGRLLPVTGNTYRLVSTGAEAGEEFTFYVMDESGDVCLAKSEKDAETGTVTIAFNTEALREQFAKDWHEVCVFHTCCSNGSATIAESDLSVTWNPLWTDVETGSAWSMRGPQGVGISSVEFVSTDDNGNIIYQFRLTNGGTAQWLAPRGPKGPATNLGCVYDELGDKKWHKIIIRTNRFGEKVLDVDPVGSEEQPDTEDIVTISGDQVITGKKTFNESINAVGGIEGDIHGDADTSKKLSTGRYFTVTDNTGINSQKSAGTFDGSADMTLKLPSDIHANITGSVAGDVLGNVTGNVTGDVTGGITVPSGKSISCAGGATISGELDAPNVKNVAIGMLLTDQMNKGALSESVFFQLMTMLGRYFDGSWRFCPETKIPEGYCGNTEASHALTNQQNWKTIGASGDHGQRGVFGFRTTEIEKYAFYSSYYLKKIHFPNLVTIGDYAFYSPDELVSISAPVLETVGAYAFHTGTSLEGVYLPKCKNIGSYAFYGCMTGGADGAIEIRIGENAALGEAGNYNTIGDHAFAANGIAKVGKFICPNTQVFGDYCTANGTNSGELRNVTELDIHNAVIIGNYAFCWLNYGKTDAAHRFALNLPECVSIGSVAFGSNSASHNLQSISSLTAPKLTTIGLSAFYYQNAMTSVDCALLTSIGNDAFRYCSALTSVSIPSVASIGDTAFYGCSALTTISLPSILNISTNGFGGCTLLKDVRIPNKTVSEVQNMTAYPWGLSAGCVITCADGTITLS